MPTKIIMQSYGFLVMVISKKQLYDYTQQDKRIHFGGVIPLSEVIEKEIQATILINPRPVDQEFTKYSFPSKIMEYMSSGTPVLTTKLPVYQKSIIIIFIQLMATLPPILPKL